jgi:hypothetical protein
MEVSFSLPVMIQNFTALRMNKIRTAVIGVGYLGQFHAEKYAGLPNVELVGVADQDGVRAGQIAAKLGTRAFSEPEQLLGSVDAVSIVVPSYNHATYIGEALDSALSQTLPPAEVLVVEGDDLLVFGDGVADLAGADVFFGQLDGLDLVDLGAHRLSSVIRS